MFAIKPPTRPVYFGVLCALTLYVAVGSILPALDLDLPGPVRGLFYRFSLANEATVGTWWSGMLLLLGALHAIDGYYRYRSTDARLAKSWLVIGAVLAALSLDEIGSFHERMGSWFQTKQWLLAIAPFGLALLAAVAWAVLQLWTRAAQRSSCLLLVAGFTCFVTVVGQEYIEHLLTWPQWAKPIRMIIEEGTELLGMLLIIRAGMPNSSGLFAASRDARPVALRAAYAMPSRMLLLAIAAIPVMALMTAHIQGDGRGRPSDWFAAALFFVAALAVLRNFLAGASLSVWRATLALLCFGASLSVVWLTPDLAVTVGETVLERRNVVLAVLLVVASAMLAVRGKPYRGACYVLLAVAGVTLMFAFEPPDPLRTFLLNGIIAIIVYCVAAPHVAIDAVRRLLGSRGAEHPSAIADAEAVSGLSSTQVSQADALQFQLLEHAHDAVIIWEMDGRGIQYWNRAAERLYGYKFEDAKGKVTHELLRTRVLGTGVTELEERIAKYGMWVGELHHYDQRGERIEVESRLSLISQEHGRWLVLEVNRALADPVASQSQRETELQLFNLRRRSGATPV